MESEAKELKERVVRKELSWDHVRVAAFLGDASASVVFARAPTTLEPYSPPPAPKRSLWARLTGKGAVSPLELWVQSIERLSQSAAIRLAVAVAELLLEPWQLHNPRRPEPAEAIEWARQLAAGAPFDEEERHAVLSACVESPPGSELRGPLRRSAALIALWIDQSTVQDSLADLVPAVIEVLAAGLGDAAGRVMAEGRIAAGASDFAAWEAARAERERVGTSQAAAEALQAAVAADLIPWILSGPPIDPTASLRVRRPQQSRAALESLTHVTAHSAAPPAPSPLELAAPLLGGGIVGGILRAAAADQRIDARLARRKVMDDPYAKWDCPKCAALNPNTTSRCTRCAYLLQ